MSSVGDLDTAVTTVGAAGETPPELGALLGRDPYLAPFAGVISDR